MQSYTVFVYTLKTCVSAYGDGQVRANMNEKNARAIMHVQSRTRKQKSW